MEYLRSFYLIHPFRSFLPVQNQLFLHIHYRTLTRFKVLSHDTLFCFCVDITVLKLHSQQ